jgi:hypothetical protein
MSYKIGQKGREDTGYKIEEADFFLLGRLGEGPRTYTVEKDLNVDADFC